MGTFLGDASVILSIRQRGCHICMPLAVQVLLLVWCLPLVVDLLLFATEVLIMTKVLNWCAFLPIGISLRNLARRHGLMRRLIVTAREFLILTSALPLHLAALLHIEIIRICRFKLMLLVKDFVLHLFWRILRWLLRVARDQCRWTSRTRSESSSSSGRSWRQSYSKSRRGCSSHVLHNLNSFKFLWILIILAYADDVRIRVRRKMTDYLRLI